ncbi:hypothetical protein [Mumia sp. DW29H23]|uniref:hypothetical protein n=1 Tax=Mumia sp. DW29H23 TaxID=3421241 RepID=UPI003D681604
MSNFEPARLYLWDRAGETWGVYGFEHVGPACAPFEEVARFFPDRPGVTNPRRAIVLDPQDEDVQAFVQVALAVGSSSAVAVNLARKIAAQSTPPKPPMEEPQEWGAKVTDDRADWIRVHGSDVRKGWYAPADVVWDDWASMLNPRPYEGVRDGD